MVRQCWEWVITSYPGFKFYLAMSKKNFRTFLHGQLLLEIKAASNLPDMESWVSKLVNPKDVTDAFVDVKLGSAHLVKTSVINNSLNPEWNEDYLIQV